MEAACKRLAPAPEPGIYQPRRPADTPLYRVVRENLESYLARAREACVDHDPVPPHVERTFRKYLECGILAHGFARVVCDRCKHEFLLAFSCKQRGVCPSCNTRRMAETAANLVDHVLPRVPMRQWVLSVPKRVRWFLQHDRAVASRVLRIFLGEVERTLRQCSPGAPRAAGFGAVAFHQRFGGSLNEHPHIHALVTDGVFVEDGEAVKFLAATDLDQEKIEEVETRVRRRVLRWLARKGLLESADAKDMLTWEHGGGFSVDGSVRLESWDRQGLERVARYCARPSFAGERFAALDDGKVAYRLPKPTMDGQTLLVMDPLELLDKLAKLIPPPRAHQVRYFGALAPNSHLRERAIESAGPSGAIQLRLEEAARKMGLPHPKEPAPKKRASRIWAMLMARIYEVLPLLCMRCNAPMRVVAFITDSSTVTKILDHIGEPSTAADIPPARGPPQEEFTYDA